MRAWIAVAWCGSSRQQSTRNALDSTSAWTEIYDAIYGDIKYADIQVAVLPIGAIELHNLHLPHGTDVFKGTIVGERICEAAHTRGGKLMLLPTVPFGVETNMRAFPLAINARQETLSHDVCDVVNSL